MIECKEILNLCDRFENYLVPLDIHVLRQRYNGKTFKSTIQVGLEMNISDETVRTIENRALDAISHCLDLEANGQVIIPIRLAKSFVQPTASRICIGAEPIATCAVYTAHRGELIIFASSLTGKPSHPFTPFSFERTEGLPLGAIVGRVILIDCYHAPSHDRHPHQWRLIFEQPETFLTPIPYKGSQGFFYVSNEISRQLPQRYPFCF